MPLVHPNDATLKDYDICVVGAGPAGLATALTATGLGLSCLIVEAGGLRPDPRTAEFSRAEIALASHHSPLEKAVCRVVGGASVLWGGRCVPFDALDFRRRPGLRCDGWPIGPADLSEWHGAAAAFLGCSDVFADGGVDGLGLGEGVSTNRLEQWCPVTDMFSRHRRGVLDRQGPDLLVDAVATDLHFQTEATCGRIGVETLGVRADSSPVTIRARHFVLACGGLETTRLLLMTQRRHPALLGSEGGPLGRYYMGHLTGVIAEAAFRDAAMAEHFDFRITPERHVVRRRLTLPEAEMEAQGLGNTAFWIENLPIAHAQHGSAILSLKYLILRQPMFRSLLMNGAAAWRSLAPEEGETLPHLKNLAREPLQLVNDLARLLKARYLDRPRRLDRLASSVRGSYALRYHAEHRPDPENRVMLSDETDPAGMPRLRIAFSYGDDDFLSVFRSHELLRKGLDRQGTMRLRYTEPPKQLREAVRRQSTDGYHQIGTTRMSASPGRGVVDPDLRVHEFSNLFVASSSVFPSSGQCNPTFPLVALSIRLAHRLAAERRSAAGCLRGARGAASPS